MFYASLWDFGPHSRSQDRGPNLEVLLDLAGGLLIAATPPRVNFGMLVRKDGCWEVTAH